MIKVYITLHIYQKKNPHMKKKCTSYTTRHCGGNLHTHLWMDLPPAEVQWNVFRNVTLQTVQLNKPFKLNRDRLHWNTTINSYNVYYVIDTSCNSFFEFVSAFCRQAADRKNIYIFLFHVFKKMYSNISSFLPPKKTIYILSSGCSKGKDGVAVHICCQQMSTWIRKRRKRLSDIKSHLQIFYYT